MAVTLKGLLLLLGLSAITPAWASRPAAWTQPIKPFQIAPHIFYVGSKGLSAYLVTSHDGSILIDGTLKENALLIERNIKALGVPLSSVKWILCDHAHDDHVGALAQIKMDTHARFAASAADQIALERGFPRGDTDYSPNNFAPIRVDRVIGEGSSIAVGDVVLFAHLTPGHTPGCTSWSTTVGQDGRPLHVLFLCSITVAGNRLIGNQAYPKIAEDYEKTFHKLSTMKADVVLTSHPEVADVLGREARVEAGDRRAFIDPQALGRIVVQANANFEAALAEARQQRAEPSARLRAPSLDHRRPPS